MTDSVIVCGVVIMTRSFCAKKMFLLTKLYGNSKFPLKK